MEFYFIPYNYPDVEYDYDIRYWKYEEGIVLAVTFIPSEECDEVTANRFVSMAADSIEMSFEYGGQMFIATNPKDIEEFIEYNSLNVMFFLRFPSQDKMELYIARMVKEEIF